MPLDREARLEKGISTLLEEYRALQTEKLEVTRNALAFVSFVVVGSGVTATVAASSGVRPLIILLPILQLGAFYAGLAIYTTRAVISAHLAALENMINRLVTGSEGWGGPLSWETRWNLNRYPASRFVRPSSPYVLMIGAMFMVLLVVFAAESLYAWREIPAWLDSIGLNGRNRVNWARRGFAIVVGLGLLAVPVTFAWISVWTQRSFRTALAADYPVDVRTDEWNAWWAALNGE